ncbi:MAG: hypothetical protein S4CHLAM20_11570 [Chlamydiia bacterium]|nr:hypothetical protein [Chlamydiia bacterium]
MKILLIAIGSRGDIEPFLAAGELLKEQNHKVEFSFPEQFRGLAKDLDCPFYSLGSELLDLIDCEDGKIVIGGHKSIFRKLKAFWMITKKSMKIQKKMVLLQEKIIEKGNYDKIIFHIKAVYPVLWGIKYNKKTQILSPVPCIHYVASGTQHTFGTNLPTFVNKLTFSFAHMGIITMIKKASKWLKISPKLSFKEIKTALFSTPTVYTISPTLFPKPSYWDKHLTVLGFHERNRTINWKPSNELISFFEIHSKPLFITFGSMVNQDAHKRTQLLVDILEKHKIPAIFNTAGGGLITPETYNQNLFHFESTIPYEWILPKVYGMIHHGGAGTTHSSLKYGCATLIIPHIVDQFIWNNVVKNRGAGPKGISSQKINFQNLESLILDLYQNPIYKVRAENIAASMEKEKLSSKLTQVLST